MSGMCQRCFYDLALPNGDLCAHCRHQQQIDAAATEAEAKRLTAEHEAMVLAQEESA